MNKTSSVVEVILKFKKLGKKITQEAEKEMKGLAVATDKAAKAGKRQSAAAKKQRQNFNDLAKKVKGLAAAYVGLAGAKKAIQLSAQQERAELRLLGILRSRTRDRANEAAQFERIASIASDLQTQTQLFGDEQFLDAAGTFLATASDTNTAIDETQRNLLATAKLAVALFDGQLEPAARNLARTLSGQAGELGEKIPELARLRRELGEENFRKKLEGGLAFDLVEDLFGDILETVQGANFARNQAAINRFGDVMERTGNILLRLVNPALEGFAGILEFVVDIVDRLRGKSAEGGGPVEDVRGFFEDIATVPTLLLGKLGNDWLARQALLADHALRRQRKERTEVPAAQQRSQGGGVSNAASNQEPFQEILLDRLPRRDLLVQIGLVSDLTGEMIRLENAFQKIDGFHVPEFLGAPVEDVRTDADALFNLAQAMARVTAASEGLDDAGDRFRKAVAASNEGFDSGRLSAGERDSSISDARSDFLTSIAAANAELLVNEQLIESNIAKLEELAVLPFPIDETQIQPLQDLQDELANARDAYERFGESIGELSDELGERLKDPMADFLVAFSDGEQGLEDFGLTFARIMQRILAEQAALSIIESLFGGKGKSGGSGLVGAGIDLVGGLLGFDQGGQVPGPDSGRDDRIVAVRGGEYMVRPEAVRQPGVLDMLHALNAGGSGLRPVGHNLAAHTRGIPGYAGGGFVDIAARIEPPAARRGDDAAGNSGAGGTFVLPAITADERTMERLHAGGRTAMLDAIRENAAEIASHLQPHFSGSTGL